MPGLFNNREWATLIWGAVLLAWLLTQSGMRSALRQLVVALFRWKLLACVAVMTAWIAGLVIGGRAVGLWVPSMLGSTILWFVGAVFIVGMFGAMKVSTETGYIRNTMVQAIGLAAAVVGAEGLYVFPLVGELALVLAVATLASLSVVAKNDPELASVAKGVDVLLGLIAIGLLTYVIGHLTFDLAGADIGSHVARGPHCGQSCVVTIDGHRAHLTTDWRSLALPAWLTIGLLPVVYVVGLLSAYERSFLLFTFTGESDKAERRAKWALLIGVNIHVRWLGEFRAPWPYRIAREPDLRSAVSIARAFRRTPLSELGFDGRDS